MGVKDKRSDGNGQFRSSPLPLPSYPLPSTFTVLPTSPTLLAPLLPLDPSLLITPILFLFPLHPHFLLHPYPSSHSPTICPSSFLLPPPNPYPLTTGLVPPSPSSSFITLPLLIPLPLLFFSYRFPLGHSLLLPLLLQSSSTPSPSFSIPPALSSPF